MADKRPPDKNRAIGLYFVAVLDLVGQSQKLQEFLPTVGHSKSPKDPAFDATFAMVNSARVWGRGLATSFASMKSTVGMDKVLSPTELQSFYSFELKLMTFSDSFFYYGRLDTDNLLGSLNGLTRCIEMMCLRMIEGLGYLRPMRGAICVGLAAEIEEGEIYGPALARAHYLETHCARWPRVVVDTSVVAFLKKHRATGKKIPKRLHLRNKLVDRALGLIRKPLDSEDFLYLDFLGLRPPLETEETFIAETAAYMFLEEGHGFIKREYIRYRDERHPKLHFYYAMLLNYYEERIANWYGQSYQPKYVPVPPDPKAVLPTA